VNFNILVLRRKRFGGGLASASTCALCWRTLTRKRGFNANYLSHTFRSLKYQRNPVEAVSERVVMHGGLSVHGIAVTALFDGDSSSLMKATLHDSRIQDTYEIYRIVF
jgi:hypothetical protein